MRVVNMTELKKGLRRHLRDVRKGEEILISLLRPGRRPTKAFWRKFWAMPAPRIPMKHLLKAISDEREED